MEKDVRLKKYYELDEALQDLFSSDKSMTMYFYMVTKYNIENKDIFIECIGDTILGFHHTKDLPQLLQKEVGLGADEAQNIVADLAEFLTPVLEREAAEAGKKQQELQSLGDQIGRTPETTDEELNPEEALSSEPETEDTYEVQPMRTMKGDMKRVHGYGAYREEFPTTEPAAGEPAPVRSEQAAVLKKQSLVDTPHVDE